MGNLAVILALGALIVGSLVLWNGRRHTAAAQDQSSAYAVERLAREAAQVGLQDALRELNDEVDEWPATLSDAQTRYNVTTTTHGTGSYEVTLDNLSFGTTPTDPDRVWLTATGRHDGYDPTTGTTATTEVVLKTVYETANTDIGLPPSMRQAVQTNEDLTIKGNACISGATHSNGATATSGNTFDVLGTGSSTGGTSTTAQGEARFTGGLVPSDSVDIPAVPFPPSSVTSTQTIPTLSAANDPYAPGATPPTTALVDGWFGVTGKGGPGVGNEYVLYVPGDLTLSGAVHLIGYSRIYVGGTLTISGNASITPTHPSAGLPAVTASMNCAQRMNAIKTWTDANLPNGQSTLAFYVNGDIEMGGNTSVVAHLWSNSAFTYSGGGNSNRLIIGGVTAQNDLEMKGTTMIYYTEAGQSVVPGGNEQGYDGLRLVGYAEHVAL